MGKIINKFKDMIKVKPEIISFPLDEDVEKASHNLNMKNIERKTKATIMTKKKKPVFIYKNKPHLVGDGNDSEYRVIYYLIGQKAEFLGKVTARLFSKNIETVEIEYHTVSTRQREGIATIGVKDVINSIFEKKDLNNLYEENKVTTIKLSISEDNIASKKVASHCGFLDVNKGIYELSSIDYDKNLEI